MIDSKELRIGNYINIEGNIIKIGIQAIVDIENSKKQNKNLIKFEPILITKELIKQLGFEHDSGNWFKLIIRKRDSISGIIYNYKTGELIIGYDRDWLNVKRTYQYLHNLQNIIYDLTRLELEIKE